MLKQIYKPPAHVLPTGISLDDNDIMGNVSILLVMVLQALICICATILKRLSHEDEKKLVPST